MTGWLVKLAGWMTRLLDDREWFVGLVSSMTRLFCDKMVGGVGQLDE